MIGRAILPEIGELVQQRDFATLKQVFEDWHPSELVDVIADLHEKERAVVFRLLSKEKAADTFEYLDFETQMSLLKALGQEEVGAILNEVAPDDRTAFLEELPGPIVRQLIELLSPTERSVAKTLLGYPVSSVCRLMTPKYIAVPPEWTVGRVLEHIRSHGKNIESLDYLYVVDASGKLIDDVPIRDVLVAPLESPLSELMDDTFVNLTAADTRDRSVELFKQYDRSALPVTNSEGFLLGIVTIDTSRSFCLR